MKTNKQCQVSIFYLDNNADIKERVLPQMLTAKDAIAWGDRIRELQGPSQDIGFSTGIKING